MISQGDRIGKRIITRKHREPGYLVYEWRCDCGTTGELDLPRVTALVRDIAKGRREGWCKGCRPHKGRRRICARCGAVGHVARDCPDAVPRRFGPCARMSRHGERCSKTAWHMGECGWVQA